MPRLSLLARTEHTVPPHQRSRGAAPNAEILAEELQRQRACFVVDGTTIDAGIVVAYALNVDLHGPLLTLFRAARHKIVVPYLPGNLNQSSTRDQTRMPLRVGCRRRDRVGGSNHDLDWNLDIGDILC